MKFLENTTGKQIQYQLGHGVTPCDEQGNPEIVEMPWNAALITASQCGLPTLGSYSLEAETIGTLTPNLVHDILERKDQQSTDELLKKQKKIYSQPPRFLEKSQFFQKSHPSFEKQKDLQRSFQVVLPTETWQDVIFQAGRSLYNSNRKSIIGPNGLYDIYTLTEMLNDSEAAENRQGLSINAVGARTANGRTFTFYDAFEFMYKQSLWPKLDTVQEVLIDTFFDLKKKYPTVIDNWAPKGIYTKMTLENVDMLEWLINDTAQHPAMNIRVSELVKEFPGIHVYNVCRSFGETCNANPLLDNVEVSFGGGRKKKHSRMF